ncbi:MAG: hypothetical protein GWO24_34910, partial [Akkermansiaceae bacterium]|nr:hypothetical protein [Akkermansiaceae bacterium]
ITREEALARLAAIRGFHKDKAMAGIGECPAALDDVPDVEPFRVAEIVALRCGILTD